MQRGELRQHSGEVRRRLAAAEPGQIEEVAVVGLDHQGRRLSSDM